MLYWLQSSLMDGSTGSHTSAHVWRVTSWLSWLALRPPSWWLKTTDGRLIPVVMDIWAVELIWYLTEEIIKIILSILMFSVHYWALESILAIVIFTSRKKSWTHVLIGQQTDIIYQLWWINGCNFSLKRSRKILHSLLDRKSYADVICEFKA